MATPPKHGAAWNGEGLADDVATISYGQALRTHTRVFPRASDAQSDPETVGEDLTWQKCESDHTTAPRPLKTASITIRISETESAHLRRRAAEAGMTVSAYLRSCTLEVESLRSQVKETLAQMRASAVEQTDDQRKNNQTGWFTKIVSGANDLLRKLLGRHRPVRRLNPANPFATVR